MKKFTIIFILFFQLLNSYSQEKGKFVIFENSENWKREVIKFPIDWVPKLNLTGFEELLFSPNWKDSKSSDFWSLVMGWKVKATSQLTLKEIEYNLNSYFDGLMKPNHWAKKFPEPKIYLRNNKNGFYGTMTVFDGFHSGKLLILNILGEQIFDKKQKKSIITFRLSPKKYQHKIWETLNSFKLKRSEFDLINLNSTWGKEVIRFPARNLNYIGVGEVRFPPKGWINPKHNFFWSYTYAWNINLNKRINSKTLVSNLKSYFNSLNRVDINDKYDLRKTTAIVIEKKRIKNFTFFEGEVEIYDRFATKKRLILNTKITSHYCKKENKTIIHFKFSPKEFSHKTWETLDKIELIKGICKEKK